MALCSLDCVTRTSPGPCCLLRGATQALGSCVDHQKTSLLAHTFRWVAFSDSLLRHALGSLGLPCYPWDTIWPHSPAVRGALHTERLHEFIDIQGELTQETSQP